MEKVCKVEKLRSTFHTFHDYLNFCGEKKDDRLFTIYAKTKGLKGILYFKTVKDESITNVHINKKTVII